MHVVWQVFREKVSDMYLSPQSRKVLGKTTDTNLSCVFIFERTGTRSSSICVYTPTKEHTGVPSKAVRSSSCKKPTSRSTCDTTPGKSEFLLPYGSEASLEPLFTTAHAGLLVLWQRHSLATFVENCLLC